MKECDHLSRNINGSKLKTLVIMTNSKSIPFDTISTHLVGPKEKINFCDLAYQFSDFRSDKTWSNSLLRLFNNWKNVRLIFNVSRHFVIIFLYKSPHNAHELNAYMN